MELNEFLAREMWNVSATLEVPGRDAALVSCTELQVSEVTSRYLRAAAPNGVYGHQQDALVHSCQGHPVCIATGTASGKSLVFYATAIEQLSRQASAKTLALYPLKALGRQQEERWGNALQQAGLDCIVGRIDGGVPPARRPEILRSASVVTMTPDVMHAWLLPNIHMREVRAFLQRLRLVVVDEVHTYTGVFGSNAAFLFRRLQHLLALLRANPCYICASATIAEPREHLHKLLGLDFHLIGPEADTSPRHPLTIQLVEAPGDPLTEVPKLMAFLAAETSSRFITFVDSRKQTEHLSSITARTQDHDRTLDDHLRELNILPYRAGYEESDRQLIQDRLVSGSLSGVISTSALELGIDIAGIDTGILMGVPASSTALSQRIGRVGRHCAGRVIVVKAGGMYDDTVFRNPEMLLQRPAAQGALYLENQRIQYIHALCLARHNGEHDAVAAQPDEEFESPISWPPGFEKLCAQERLGEVPPDLRSMKQEAGDDPAHTFPLRDVESQFAVECRQGPDMYPLGSLSHGQVMREAYPGAVYYYTTRPYRVTRVRTRAKTIEVREEKKYTTRPSVLPTMVFPNLTSDNILKAMRCGELLLVECNVQIREAVAGFRERRGPSEFLQNYPMNAHGIEFPLPLFTRNYFTTGTVLTHPALSEDGVKCSDIASILFEATLIAIPFERQDINSAADRHRVKRGPLEKNARFVVIYDQTYGSLRLSGRLLDEGILNAVANHISSIVSFGDIDIDQPTVAALTQLVDSCQQLPVDARREFLDEQAPIIGDKPLVICPGSRGLHLDYGNLPFTVADVFFNPRLSAVCYRGVLEGYPDEEKIIPIDHVIEIPGESKLAFYDLERGLLEEI